MSANIWAADAFPVVNAANAIAREEFEILTPDTSSVTLTTFSYVPGNSSIELFINGLRQRSGIDFEESSNITISLIGDTFYVGDIVTVVGQLSLDTMAAETVMQNLADQAGAGYIGHIATGAGAVTTTVQAKLRESVSVKDFGAKGDNVSNEVPFFTLAKSNGKAAIMPFGTYKFDSAFDSGDTPLVAFGATLNPSVPASTYLRSYIDLGKKAIFRQSLRAASEYSGTPTSYSYLTDLTSFNIKHTNSAGYQQNFTTDAGGRTSVPAIYLDCFHDGYGDMPGVSTHIGVSKHASYLSNTSWTGANSAVLYDGEAGAVTDNVNLYGCEFHLTDNAHGEVTAHGAVYSFNRDSVSAALNNVWTGVRLLTLGTQYADSGFSVNGKWKVGVDFSGATLKDNCAIAFKASDRMYFGVPATAAPTWYASTLSTNYVDFSGGKYNFVANSVAALAVSDTEVAVTPVMKMVGSFNVPSAGNVVSTVGVAGSAAALPANPFTYLKIKIDGATYKIPVYNN